MSVQASKFVIGALRASEAVMRSVGDRLFFIGREDAAEEADIIPYVVVMPQGVTTAGNKDDDEDEVVATVDVLVVAASGDGLMTLAEDVHQAIRHGERAREGWPFVVTGLSYSAAPAALDPWKPCYYQTLTFSITTEEL